MFPRSEVPAELRPAADKATDKQVAFLRSLLAEREIPANEEVSGETRRASAIGKLGRGEFTKRQASKTIEWLLTLPKLAAVAKGPGTPTPEFADLPAGRYALATPTDNLNPVKFYKLRHGKDSRARGGKDWRGFIFVDRFSGDELYPVKGSTRLAVLKVIAANPLEAAQRYGHEHNCCGICGRNLTRAISREMGIGPVCADKLGIAPQVVQAVRRELRARGIDPDGEVADNPLTVGEASGWAEAARRDPNVDWAARKVEFAAREREQEAAAYAAKAARDAR